MQLDIFEHSRDTMLRNDALAALQRADLPAARAWALTERPALAQPSLQDAPERAMRLMLDLLNLEHQGRHDDLVSRRRQLRDLQPSIYQAYIKTR